MNTVCCLLLWIVLAAPSSMAAEENAKSVEFGRSLLSAQPAAKFSATTFKGLPAHVQSQSNNFLRRCLNRPALPFAVSGLQTKQYASSGPSESDLILYAWEYEKAQLEVVESRNALRLSIPLDRAREMLPDIVKLSGEDIYGHSYEVVVDWPAELRDGVEFSSNAEQDPRTMLAWHQRLDFHVAGDRLEVFIYKKIPQLMGYQRGDVWFKSSPK